MNKFKYLKISNTKKIRYFTNYYKKNLYIVFLHGFMSDLEGEKPKAFLKYCILLHLLIPKIQEKGLKLQNVSKKQARNFQLRKLYKAHLIPNII